MASNDEKVEKSIEDPELDELLDSALADFTKKDEKTSTDEETEKSGSNSGIDLSNIPENLDDQWSAEFIKQAVSQIESNMSSFLSQMSEPSDINLNIQRMAAQMLGEAPRTEGSGDSDLPADNLIASTINDTIKNLSEGAQTAQNAFSEENITNMLSQMGLGGGEEAEQGMFNFMQGIMKSLLSKDLVYPSLKDTSIKYPIWLEENKDKLDPNDLERFKQQSELMQAVCTEFENETDQDSEEVRNERYNRILHIMEKLQGLGHPPKELVGEINEINFSNPANLPFPPNLPGMPNDPNQQCSIM